METYEPFASLGVSLVVGLLLGFEREQSAPERSSTDGSLGGARTYPLFSLCGAVAALVSQSAGVSVLVAVLLGVLAVVVVQYAADVKRERRGLTSEAALLLGFLLGAFAVTPVPGLTVRERAMVALSVAIVATLLLSAKSWTKSFASKVSKDDLFATLKFLLVSVVVLPLLPDENLGPYDALNPFHVGLMAVLIAGISFVGYVAVRLLGPDRGIGVTGLVGGLVSSTAVTLSMADRAKRNPELSAVCLESTVLASTVMAGRVLLAVGVASPSILRALAWPLGGMLLVGAALSVGAWLRGRASGPVVSEGVVVTNPFELSSALKFAGIFGLVLVLAKVATVNFGTGATYLAALLAGATDVDAITLSMARLAQSGEVLVPVASTAILLGVASNTCVKGGMAVFAGGWVYGRKVLAAFGAMVVGGAAGLVVVWWN